MIPLGENRQTIRDEGINPNEGIKRAFISQNAMCFHASDDVLYRFYPDGSPSLYSLSRPKLKTIILSRLDLDFFYKEGRVVTKDVVVRDVGYRRSMMYMEEHSFCVLTELLHR